MFMLPLRKYFTVKRHEKNLTKKPNLDPFWSINVVIIKHFVILADKKAVSSLSYIIS